MLMYGRVVHKRVWKEVPEEGKHAGAKHEPKQAAPPPSSGEPSAEPRDTPFVADGFLSVQDERAQVPDRRPESLSPCLLHLHTMLETSARHTEPSHLLALPLLWN